jgi:hypothetical protein
VRLAKYRAYAIRPYGIGAMAACANVGPTGARRGVLHTPCSPQTPRPEVRSLNQAEGGAGAAVTRFRSQAGSHRTANSIRVRGEVAPHAGSGPM